jgi:hypothetical protein
MTRLCFCLLALLPVAGSAQTATVQRGLSLLQIAGRLREKPGDVKKLDLERAGKQFQIQAAVTRLM